MAGRKNGLGRGLDAFFPDRTSVVKEPARKTITKTVKTEKKSDVAEKQTNPTVAKKQTADSKTGAMIVKISSVEPNMDQPRKQFDEDALMELSESIKQYGVLHPLLVSDKKDYYEIIAGERRWRAAKLAGLNILCFIFPLLFSSVLSVMRRSCILHPGPFRSDFLPLQVSDAGFSHGHPQFWFHRQSHIPIHDRGSDFLS